MFGLFLVLIILKKKRCSAVFFSWQKSKMNVGVAHSEVNPNTRVMNSRGIWLTYALGVGMLHIVLLSIPFFSVPVVWTLTNVIHNFVSILCWIILCCMPFCSLVYGLSFSQQCPAASWSLDIWFFFSSLCGIVM